VFVGCHRIAVAPRGTGLGPPQHSSSGLGKSKKEGRNSTHVLNDFLPLTCFFVPCSHRLNLRTAQTFLPCRLR
jgi:hypothetical protein